MKEGTVDSDIYVRRFFKVYNDYLLFCNRNKKELLSLDNLAIDYFVSLRAKNT